jgi:hypothetical protein
MTGHDCWLVIRSVNCPITDGYNSLCQNVQKLGGNGPGEV